MNDRVEYSNYGGVFPKVFKHIPDPNTPYLLFDITVEGILVGHVHIEHKGPVGMIHLGMYKHGRTRPVLSKLGHLFVEQLVPVLKTHGLTEIVTVCNSDDKGTIRMMKTIGMEVVHMAHGRIKL